MPLLLDESKFTLTADGVCLVCPCIVLSLYLDLTDDSALLDFYEQSLKALEGRLTYVIVENAVHRVRTSARNLSMVPTWIKKPREYKRYFIEFSGGETGASAASLMMAFQINRASAFTPEKQKRRRDNWRTLTQQNPGGMGLPLSVLRVTFPLDHPLANPKAILAWMDKLQLVRDGSLVSGYCGLGLNDYIETGDNTLGQKIRETIASHVLQYPGLDWDGSVSTDLLVFRQDADDLLPHIKRVNWLTFVGKRSVEFLGGLNKLKAELSSNSTVLVREYPWGAMIQTGPEPKLGDVGHRDFIPIYRKVASVLRPIRLAKFRGSTLLPDEAANEWLNAFDRDYD